VRELRGNGRGNDGVTGEDIVECFVNTLIWREIHGSTAVNANKRIDRSSIRVSVEISRRRTRA